MLIDVHAHQFPDRYTALMAQHGRRLLGVLTGPVLEQRIQQMDEAQVDMQVLSPSNLMPYLENEADARNAARILNDDYAELSHRLPHRFKAYVSLPLPHVDASLREMERGLDELGLAGITLGCSILNRSVTDQEFEPLYREMNRRRAVLFFHPMVNGICSPMITDFGLEGAAGTTIEDTVVVLQMIVRQIPHRYPDIRMIVPHLGGLTPMLLNRMDNQIAALHRDLPEKPSLTARRFWYDTVSHGSGPALRCACEAFGPERLVTGSDYPVLLAYESYAKTFSYIRDAGLDATAVEHILHRNAPLL
ncbi:MAG: amidohydrolase, partial [Deltaproteobacteria bacterium]|nr:amidohydrolase [Deltaproteobacteria bacterium]